jgi:hypothetical protein
MVQPAQSPTPQVMVSPTVTTPTPPPSQQPAGNPQGSSKTQNPTFLSSAGTTAPAVASGQAGKATLLGQ